MEKTHIPDDLLDGFLNTGGGGSDNGSGGGTSDEEVPQSLKNLERSLTWMCNFADNYADERGYPGLAKMDSKELAKLTRIVIQKNFGDDAGERSPELLLGLCLSAIVGANLAYGKRVSESPKGGAADAEEK